MMDWDFELPDGFDSFGDNVHLDVDHDGISEATGGVIDIDHDGIPESMNGIIDLDHDGIPEGTIGGTLDVDHDGIPESMNGIIDLHHDGIPEGSTPHDHLDTFLTADHASAPASTVSTAVAATYFPDPFAGI